MNTALALPGRETLPLLKPGDTFMLDGQVSVQFAGRRLPVRVIKMSARRSSVAGWGWAEVYVLDNRGNATERREVFINLAALN
ncbi:hypothetical protein [Longispora albida]|uniref:hypothetical protein n=1 Tax=Longispora albida TaxID=203523 RepID=UPI0003789C0C|nr:hypothetical protein [Longispora albida]